MLFDQNMFSNSLLAFPEPLFKVFHDTTLFGDGTRAKPLRVVSSGGGTWGSITGTLSSQADLQTALNAKLNTASFVPAGSNTQLQFNNSGVFGASSNLTYNGTALNIGTHVSAATTERLLMKASSVTNADVLIDARTSTDLIMFQVKNGGQIYFTSFATPVNGSTDFYLAPGDDRGIFFTGNGATTNTSGNRGIVRIGNDFNSASGTAIWNTLLLASTINQTGGANGITRGIYVNETITAAADYYAIETSKGKIKFTDTHSSGSGSLAGSILDIAQTWNTSGSPTAIKLNVTNTASGSTSKLLDLQVGGTSVFSIAKGGNVVSTGPVRLKGYTVATLPAGVQGDSAYCTDLLTPTFFTAAVGGGAVVGPVFFNGSAWICT